MTCDSRGSLWHRMWNAFVKIVAIDNPVRTAYLILKPDADVVSRGDHCGLPGIVAQV